MHKNNTETSDELLTISQVCQRLRISRTTFTKLRKNQYQGFPEPINMTGRDKWLLSSIEEWLKWKSHPISKLTNSGLNEDLAALEEQS